MVAMKGRYANLRRIEKLDPEVDYDEIFQLVSYYEFPWEVVQGTSIAFMRDYGVPTISDLLDRTGRFANDGQKRYDDTVLIGYEYAIEGTDSERGRASIRKLNQIHGHYGIPNHEFAYVLATTLVGPIRFIERYGWRPLHPHEVIAMTKVTTRLGQLMGIKDLPNNYAEYEKLHDDYEAVHFSYDPANARVAEASIKVVAEWYPKPVQPLYRRVVLTFLDEPLLRALGLKTQPAWLVSLLNRVLQVRRRLIRYLPPRAQDNPYRHDAGKTYPFGYKISDLGPRDHSSELHRHAPVKQTLKGA
jgi:hypothetical protein